MTTKKPRKLNPNRTAQPELDPHVRSQNFDEVNLGYSLDMAKQEAERCLLCKKPQCVPGCPVAIDIPGFIRKISEDDLAGAYSILKKSNPLPAVCGRVCPQEIQCEVNCVVGRRGDSVAIGSLERFVGDWGIAQDMQHELPEKTIQKKVAIVGSGPAGLACAQDLAHEGIEVTIFEALHTLGGVLSYGIPPFRLPRHIVAGEIEILRHLGVKFELNKVIGKLFTIEQLMSKQGFDAVFIGTGAGLPRFLGIPGEHFGGVMSANEFLTRANLMQGSHGADTPVGMGPRVAVIGAGNTAMDTARTALRMGAEVHVIYRRTETESPARVEELKHGKEEGIHFQWLTNPISILGNEEGQTRAIRCVRMELGEPDESGRRSPHAIEGSEFDIEVDTAIYALGTTVNPIISQSAPDMKTNRWGYIEVDEVTQMTSIPGVFAGGDIVTGAATVILAMGAGRKAAKGILEYLGITASPIKEEHSGESMSEVSPAP